MDLQLIFLIKMDVTVFFSNSLKMIDLNGIIRWSYWLN